MAKETAEQKLLKALQKKSGNPGGVSKKIIEKKNFNISLSILDLNKILLFAIVICALVLIYQFRSGSILLNQDINIFDKNKLSKKQEEAKIPQPKDVKFYIDSFGNRNIFKPYDISLGKAAAGQPNLAKRLSKYKLVGVAWLDLPESASVMIEDSESKTTYFLKIGEKLEDVTVKTIYTDRVVFSYENEETTIKL